MQNKKYVIVKQQDNGYYYKVVNAKTREVLSQWNSKFDAQIIRDEANANERKRANLESNH